ncbi:PAAR domain-containing protein [Yersinia kristensenii]|uniref:PAAR domain-containing protein n=1 Tax=Yersinia kristensenii TaxID=28152 RepID=UPI001C60CC8A|nr:PAAR domain-containing protein [Yersinia kristensenii]MBW5818715.1 PAAR domain-containing protein [Yersinia kristensenii]MBW5842462.1 PAAR domain-containing protein [Yersinia kristensenii]MDA5488548.1 PAAR domain-containing protein [Yersinia kristensenii]
MSVGYWIVKGDKTSCGGIVHEGMAERTFANHPVAVNGSKVSCGKHPGSYSVGGGHPGEIVYGHYVASTLYSRSTCPCKAFFIPSQTWASHGPYQGGLQAATSRAVVDSSVAEPQQFAQSAKKANPPPYLTGDKPPSEFLPDYPVLRNTKDLPDLKVRDLLRNNNHDIMFLTAEEAYEVLADWGIYQKGWVDITQSPLGEVVVNYGTNIKDVVTTSKLIVDLGGLGIQATMYINHKGTELIKLTGYPGIRKVLNAPVFAAKNAKVVDLGIGKYGLNNSIVQGARLTFYVAAAFRTLDYILNDEVSLAKFIGSLATDIVKIGISSIISGGTGTVIMAFTASVTMPIVLSVLVGFGAVYLLGVLDKKFGITDKVVELLESAQQEIVTKATEIQDGFIDILEMEVSNLLRKGVEFTQVELKKYIKKSISDLLREEW